MAYLKNKQSLSQYLACTEELEEWFEHSFLEQNIRKTEVMAFDIGCEGRDGTKHLSPSQDINSQQMQKDARVKTLGTVKDRSILWSCKLCINNPWYSHLLIKDKERLARVLNQASKII